MALDTCQIGQRGVNTHPLEVLAIVCSQLTDARTMCAALCTSSSGRQAILARCSGSLQLQLPVRHGDAEKTKAALHQIVLQANWLAEHSMTVGQLQLRCPKSAAGAAEAAMQLALRPPLQLRCLHLHALQRPAALLRQLDPSHLTKLHLDAQDVEQQTLASPLLAAALGRLTGLQELAITGSWKAVDSGIAAALAGMPQLTQLVLQAQLPAAALAKLPRQLVQLQLANPDCGAEQLARHVKALQQLQSLALVYCNSVLERSHITSHAAVWPGLPALKHLDLEFWNCEEDDSLSVEVAAGIAAATALTRLYGFFWDGNDEGVDWVAMLAPLKQLQNLSIGLPQGCRFEFGDLLSGSLAGLKCLSLAVGLRPLALFQLCYAARQVTRLVLEEINLTDDELEVIARSLSGLRQLALCACDVSSEGVVAALTLPHPPESTQLGFAAYRGIVPGSADRLLIAALRVQLKQLRPELAVVAECHRYEISKVADASWTDVVGMREYQLDACWY